MHRWLMSIGVAGEQSCASCLLAASGLTYNKNITITECGCHADNPGCGNVLLKFAIDAGVENEGNSEITDFVNFAIYFSLTAYVPA